MAGRAARIRGTPRAESPKSAPNCPRCAADESLRTRWIRDSAAARRTITLEAPVLNERSPLLYSQRRTCELFHVSDQTLRNFTRRGMRTHGTQRRPLYQPSDVMSWLADTEFLREMKRTREHIDQDEANQWTLSREAAWDKPGWYVLVPLAWDHPQREYWLRKAAAGREWDPTPAELREHYAEVDGAATDLEHDHDAQRDDAA